MAPTGAQETLIFVRPSGPSLSKAANFHLSGSESNQGEISEQSERNQSIKIRVIQSEPKILRLVLKQSEKPSVCLSDESTKSIVIETYIVSNSALFRLP